MTIDMPDSGRVEFQLSENDMMQLNISFDELDYSNIETRRVVWTLLDVARKKFNTDFDITGKLLIEVLPKAKGGCILAVTAISANGANSSSSKPPLRNYIFEFESEDALLGAGSQLCKMNISCSGGELYSKSGKYRLIINLSHDQRALKAILNEYATVRQSDELTHSYTSEHWKTVIPNNALKAISFRS